MMGALALSKPPPDGGRPYTTRALPARVWTPVPLVGLAPAALCCLSITYVVSDYAPEGRGPRWATTAHRSARSKHNGE